MIRETEDYKKEGRNSNREYKSDVFSMLLMEKARALEIYNAINGTAGTSAVGCFRVASG